VADPHHPGPRHWRLSLARTGDLLNWTPADKCLFAAVVEFPIIAWYATIWAFLLRHPESGAYFDRGLLERIYTVYFAFFLGGWFAIAVAALVLRRRSPTNRPLVHVTVQFFSLMAWAGAYLQGHYTTPFTGAVAVGGAAIAFILFEPWATLPALASFQLLLIATAVAEQMGAIPYAPIMTGPPFAHGRLSGWWIAGPVAVSYTVMFAAIALIYHVVERWRRREEELARANDIISRYVAAQLAEQIRLGRYGVMDVHERRRLTLFFSDIRGFSEIADRIEPEDLSALLNEYFAEMTAIAERYGATIDKFVGDAIMIFFGAPEATDDRDQALRAVRMAVEMQTRMTRLREKWSRQGLEEPFTIRIGINTGVASVGSFGARGRLDYTAIGRQVNLAARLQASCEPGSILAVMPPGPWCATTFRVPPGASSESRAFITR